MKERWCLCNNCLAAVRSRGERVLSRSMEFEDMADEEAENDEVMCDWCEEMFCESEMNICE